MVVPWYLMAGAGGDGTKTATGPVVTFRGDGSPLRSLLVNIEPVQEGSGDPSPDNVRPISGWTKAKVTRTGGNLFDGATNAIEQGGIYSADGGSSISDTRCRCGYIAVESNTKYTASFSLSANAKIFVFEFSGTTMESYLHVSSGWQNVPYTFTTNASTTHIRLAFAYSNNANIAPSDISNVSVSTDYTTITIPFGQTVYGGTLDVTNGVLTVDRAMVDLGTLSWTKYDVAQGTLFRSGSSIPNVNIPYNSDDFICSNYKTVTPALRAVGTIFCSVANKVDIIDDSFSDANAFQTAMSGVQLVYELATPITIQLTPTQINTLQGQNNLWADTGDSMVEYAVGWNPALTKLAVAFMGEGMK